ncbi:hypothetical protein BT69DRAFT_1326522 [Atractiella rhizophila]|nr:hypothetical protein BT69DRAFT_1326522 [Atractiella rhizophila]
MRQFIPGKETFRTVGWLNDFDFSIKLAKSTQARSAETEGDYKKDTHIEIFVMGEIGPFYLRTWDNKNDTSLGQLSGMFLGYADPTSVLGVPPLPQKGYSPLLPGSKDVNWKWDREKILSLLWNVSQSLFIPIASVRSLAPSFLEHTDQKAEVVRIVVRMVKALKDGKESLKKE